MVSNSLFSWRKLKFFSLRAAAGSLISFKNEKQQQCSSNKYYALIFIGEALHLSVEAI